MNIKPKLIQALIVNTLFVTTVNHALAATPPPYPRYNPAINISAAKQIPLEARWLHQNASHMGIVIPRSYDTNGYWQYLLSYNNEYQQYRAKYDQGNCRVGAGNDATIERVLTGNGLDLYDGAIWQIALSIAAKNNTDYVTDIKKYKDFLVNGAPGGFSSYRAYVSGGDSTPYLYNGKVVSGNDTAYFLKFISPQYAGNHDSVNGCNMDWPEWGAVTGEQAWAAFIGPIQSIYNLNDGALNSAWSSVGQGAGDYIDLAKNSLEAIVAMQDTYTGGVYRDVTMPHTPASKNISLENDFSLYAGLTLLKKALLDRAHERQTQLAATQIYLSDQQALAMVDRVQQGLIKFFTGKGGVAVFNQDQGYFYSAVDTNHPEKTSSSPYAVDVQTWGATVIANNPELLTAISSAYGEDALFKMFKSTLQQSGYYAADGKTLLGVGYTTQKPSDAHYEISGEWTLGAINAAIVLADLYKNDPEKKAFLIKTAKELLQGVTAEASSVSGGNDQASTTVSYLYANKRALIPFGWYSNAMPATASTGWSLMVNSCYNPFELGGGNHQAICEEIGIR